MYVSIWLHIFALYNPYFCLNLSSIYSPKCLWHSFKLINWHPQSKHCPFCYREIQIVLHTVEMFVPSLKNKVDLSRIHPEDETDCTKCLISYQNTVFYSFYLSPSIGRNFGALGWVIGMSHYKRSICFLSKSYNFHPILYVFYYFWVSFCRFCLSLLTVLPC